MLFWLKLGFISFGGPAGQISMMHQELVERRRWLSERRFLHALNYCMVLPGPEAQQLATYLGWIMHRTVGGVMAGVLFVLPSLAILVALSWLYVALGDTPLITGLFYGVKPAIAALVFQAAHRIGLRALGNGYLWSIAALSFCAIFALGVPFPAIVATAALIGLAGGQLAPEKFGAGGHGNEAGKSPRPALLDDHMPPPAHARFGWSRLLKLVAICGVLWGAPLSLLTTLHGGEHTLPQMAWFFTKAALMTFGGAYAVLPYVYQGAVIRHGWLTPEQMIDGLALGESTPGPLIMVVAFVGFLGACAGTCPGAENAFVTGVAGAVTATWFTFLPSFLFILGGGPVVESTRRDFKFTAPLAAVTAAVVGVVLNLAIFFAYHALWPRGFEGGFDALAACMVLGAAVALAEYRCNVMLVIAVSAVVGLVAKSAGL